MWLPTKSRLAAAVMPTGGTAAYTSLRAVAARGLLAFFLLVLPLGCAGYRLATEGSSVLGDGSKTLKVKGVDYPTLQPWLPYAIRSSLRDEIGARYLAKWVDSGSADYEIQINVISYTTRQWIRTEDDTTRLFDSSMTAEAILYDGSNNKEVWRSGKISYSDRVDQAEDNAAAAADIITQLMRMLADKMRNTF